MTDKCVNIDTIKTNIDSLIQKLLFGSESNGLYFLDQSMNGVLGHTSVL